MNSAMTRFFSSLLLAAAAAGAGEATYELAGRVKLEGQASISLFGATAPFTASTLTDASGKFTFKKLEPGEYTVSVFFPSRGEARQTVEIGPATADTHGRVAINLDLRESDFEFADSTRRRHAVSTKQLAISDRALHDYEDARKALGRRDAESATRLLERAVKLAPQFSAAWNELGTIAYQTAKYDRAEECFREALDQDSQAWEPLVNLGGVLITLGRTAEALDYNTHAVLLRPNDALANSQLGMAYFQAHNQEAALRYLDRARRLDAAHFSHPQLVMAQIHLRRGERREAASDLDDFLRHHPDWPKAAEMRQSIEDLKK
jgi:tetratricopeptide (TPR) repeat protein